MIDKEVLDSKTMEAFLEGDSMAILAFGDYFMKANNMTPIPKDQVIKFLGGWSPNYLHGVGEGWGMSTSDAIRCLYDTVRTATFIKGIKKATEALKTTFPNEEVVAIEAGCGTGILAVALAETNWDNIGKSHIELRNVQGGYIQQVSGWANLPTIEFSNLPSDGLIKGIVPVDVYQANALKVEMDVNVFDDLTLSAGTAEFLGQPHLIQIDPVGADKESYGFLYYQAGGNPPNQIYLFEAGL